MRLPEHIDLHLHTSVSDGTDSPAELLSRVREARLELFSLTDHDAIRGCGEILEELKKSAGGGPCFITGVEFSCEDEGGKYHILGYHFDPEALSICRAVEKGHALRMRKVRARLDYLREKYGFVFSEEDMAELLALSNPGKPHIGNLLVRYGYAASKEEAIRKYVNQMKFRNEHLLPEEAIRGILDAGGIPVLAHPSYGDGDQRIVGEEMEARVLRLVEMGLAGLEAYYSGFTTELRDELLALAERYELYVTAGSDYHGGNKTVALGDTNLARVSDGPAGLRRFLEIAIGDGSPCVFSKWDGSQ